MQKNISKNLVTFSLIIFLFSPLAYSQDDVKNIVILFSLNSNINAYQNILEGFNSTISDEPDFHPDILVDYLNYSKSQDENYIQYVVDQYNKKFIDQKLDLLITVGPETNALLSKHGLKALTQNPVLSLEYENLNNISIPETSGSNIFNLTVKFQFIKTLNTAFELFPDYKNVYFVSGNSDIDNYFTEVATRAAKEFESSHNLFYYSTNSFDSAKKYVNEIPEESIIIVPSFLLDERNVSYSTAEAINIIASNSKAPVFNLYDTFSPGNISIGGYLFSFRDVGKEMGRIAREMLDGKQPSDIKVDESGFYQYTFDWQQLKKWNLLHSTIIPSDSIFYNKDSNFFEDYKWYILFVVLFMIIETVMIIYLIRLHKRQKGIVKQKGEIESMYRELTREDRLMRMSQLTASLSHELNQPLTAILYNAQAGKRFLKSGKLDNNQAEEIFDNIIEDDKRAGGIIGSIKGLMKLETREMERISINAVIDDSLKIFNAEAIIQNIRIDLKLQDKDIYVLIDKIQIEQVMLNFLFNAAIAMDDYNPENKIIEIEQFLNNGYITVALTDNGPGINEDIKDELFKPFVTTRKSGFGIGLAVSRSIIEKHDGKIWAENMPGGGAKFSFRLKVASDE